MKRLSTVLRLLIWLIIAGLATSSTRSNYTSNGKVNWIEMSELSQAFEKDSSKLALVVVYADDGWSKRYFIQSFTDTSVAYYADKYFHFVKFAKEIKDTIRLKGHDFVYNYNAGRRGAHQLSIQLLDGKMEFPTTVILNSEFQVLQRLPGFIDHRKLVCLLQYFGEGHNKTTPWKEFEEGCK
ncbi:MAG: hypothetical protein KDC92_13505 [Bacteroidetes bacterium]|nr:hypothetical protein [Bacteroidota bacterium]